MDHDELANTYLDAHILFENSLCEAINNSSSDGKSGRATVVLGFPLTNKYSMIEKDDSVVIDIYQIISQLPGANYESAILYWREACDIIRPLLTEAINENLPLTVFVVGVNPSAISKLTTGLKKAGYEVDVVNFEIDVEDAVEQLMQDMREEKRFIPPKFLLLAMPKIEESIKLIG